MADSTITKRALANALKELMEQKAFSKISISDICELCDMNRKSFYYHFRDKYDLVNWIFDTEFIAVLRKQNSLEAWDMLNALSFYFYENRSFYRKALLVEGQNSFFDHFRELLFASTHSRLLEMEGAQQATDFQINFFSDAIVMTFRRWILEKNMMKPEDFVRELKKCVQLASLYS